MQNALITLNIVTLGSVDCCVANGEQVGRQDSCHTVVSSPDPTLSQGEAMNQIEFLGLASTVLPSNIYNSCQTHSKKGTDT